MAYKQIRSITILLVQFNLVFQAVVGIGSTIPQLSSSSWPHNAMSYSNINDYGSMLLTIEGNRMDAKWISTDTLQPVKDQFTIFKSRSKVDTIYDDLPKTFTLSTSW
jgi:hypothetical protein